MSLQRVTAILVVHDGATWLPEVVASIASQTRSADQIFAVDTGSRDSSAKLLKGARIPVATLERGAGFGAAIAHAVAQLPAAVEGADEWLWILHDDCTFDPRALESLLSATIDKPNVVMAGPKLLGWHDRTHLLEVGISIATNGARWTGLEPSEYDQGQHDGVREVLSVSTAGALIRRDVFEELGGFDSNLELFRDDVDFGWRARTAGHAVVAVTDAIGFHAQASSSERRSVDVESAFLHRPLLLDRRNAAYVLLANSPWFSLPLLSLQLLSGAIFRSIGYLFAKLPGYASDEILAIASLLFKPAELLAARKDRKSKRFISSTTVRTFIPSRMKQLRSSLNRATEAIREKVLPSSPLDETKVMSELTINEDEDLLTPLQSASWYKVFTQPLAAAASVIAVVSLLWTRHRIGDIAGGALAQSPAHFSQLVKSYVESWHEVGMGSGLTTPAWIVLLAIASLIFFGNVSLFITVLFLAAPFIFLVTSHRYLKKFTENAWLSAGAALLYALSPVAVTSINSGRLGVVVFLALFPIFASNIRGWSDIETRTWRSIYAHVLFIWVLFAFNPSVFIILLCAVGVAVYRDYVKVEANYRDPLFLNRLTRRLTILFLPLLLSAPNSFGLVLNPSKLLSEIGMVLPGGGPNLAFLGNPGGPGSPPWWIFSPVIVILFVTYFSTTASRKFSAIGIIFALSATLASSLIVSGNGSVGSTRVFAGTFLTISTLLALVAGVVMFDKIRARLEQSHINYRHFSVASVLLLTLIYSATSLFWLMTAGADSPLKTTSHKVLPAFLTVETSAKTLVIRPYSHGDRKTLSYYISRGGDAVLGNPDVAPRDTPVISQAVEGLVDNTGVTASKVFATYGIKYIFLKNPVTQEVVQNIDGLGGFVRTSATNAGIVWKVIRPTGQLIFTDYAGKVTILDSHGVRAYVPVPGTLTLTETYSDAWQVFQDGYKMAKVEDINGLPTFAINAGGHISVIHDGKVRRAWISFFAIVLVTTIVLALPSGRRKSEMSDREIA